MVVNLFPPIPSARKRRGCRRLQGQCCAVARATRAATGLGLDLRTSPNRRNAVSGGAEPDALDFDGAFLAVSLMNLPPAVSHQTLYRIGKSF